MVAEKTYNKGVRPQILEFVALQKDPFKPKHVKVWLRARRGGGSEVGAATVYAALKALVKCGKLQHLLGVYYAPRFWRPYVRPKNR